MPKPLAFITFYLFPLDVCVFGCGHVCHPFFFDFYSVKM